MGVSAQQRDEMLVKNNCFLLLIFLTWLKSSLRKSFHLLCILESLGKKKILWSYWRCCMSPEILDLRPHRRLSWPDGSTVQEPSQRTFCPLFLFSVWTSPPEDLNVSARMVIKGQRCSLEQGRDEFFCFIFLSNLWTLSLKTHSVKTLKQGWCG